MYKEVTEKLQEIRRILNFPLFRAKHFKNKDFWNQMWASCDVLEDTNEGIEYYRTCEYKDNNIGFKYLHLYGLLQLVFVQQNALWHLSETLGKTIEPTKTPEIDKIRDIRNSSIGHPTKKSNNEFISISRTTMNKCGFKYMKWKKDYYNIRSVNIDEVLETQLYWLIESVDILLEHLKGIWNTMCKEFEKKLMIDYIPSDLDFRMEKLTTYDKVMALNYGHKGIKDFVDKLNKEYKNRYGEDGREMAGTSYLFKELFFILNYFYEVLISTKEYNEIEYGLFSEMLRDKINKLKESCMVIDNEATTRL
ncbi:MAG: hypothetical protein PHO15_02755 [Eubacteriales bacterium]|nr:hypothetical protein [Eubacteriales bacterium]